MHPCEQRPEPLCECLRIGRRSLLDKLQHEVLRWSYGPTVLFMLDGPRIVISDHIRDSQRVRGLNRFQALSFFVKHAGGRGIVPLYEYRAVRSIDASSLVDHSAAHGSSVKDLQSAPLLERRLQIRRQNAQSPCSPRISARRFRAASWTMSYTSSNLPS